MRAYYERSRNGHKLRSPKRLGHRVRSLTPLGRVNTNLVGLAFKLARAFGKHIEEVFVYQESEARGRADPK